MTYQSTGISLEHNGQRATIAHADALDHLRGLPDGSVDLLVTSPPYCIGKEYESATSTADFENEIRRVFPEIIRVIRDGGSICWQVGSHVTKNVTVPLDYLIFKACEGNENIFLRNRIVWHFRHGINSTKRFSGRYETILWFTKGEKYYFDLDSVRERQKYPGKRYYKGPKKGLLSGNPRGKNPGDVWDIPNVKANHIEKTDHPCQFPVALVGRLVESMSPLGGVVCDPYAGSGTSAVAALLAGRSFTGSETEARYLEIAASRISALVDGSLRVREDKPVLEPDVNSSVARLPAEFLIGG